MPTTSFSRRALALHPTLLALAGPATAANVSTTAELVQHNAIPLPLWITIFGVALFLLLLSIRYNRPDGDPESAVLTASLALIFSGAATYLIGLVREVTYEIVPVVNATTGAVIDHTIQPVLIQYEIPGVGWIVFLLMIFSILSLFSAYLAMVRSRGGAQP